MSFDSLVEQTRQALREVLPDTVEVTDIELEGPHIVLYTKQLEAFLSGGDLLRQIAQRLRRRVLVRTDPASLIDPKEAEAAIRELIPREAEISALFFEPETGEVTIEAANPGAAIGRQGSVLNELKRRIGWVPTVVRTPPIPSKTVEEVRIHLRNVNDDRRAFLKKVGIKIARDRLPEKIWARNTALGGYREVGRSAHLLATQNSKVLIDCGIDPGSDRTPFFNAPELLPLDSLDAVVVTHAHLDHCGLIPVLLKYGYSGPIYATAPTRDLMALMLLDAIKVTNQEARKGLYDSSHVRQLVARTIPLRWGETTDIAPDMRLTMHNAGHILGSSICHFHLGDGDYNLAYSGDIKFERSWLFNPAANRFPRLETLILESTYGGYRDIQPSRQQATEDFTHLASKVLERGGKLIVPVFAVGRSQEVMLVLEERIRQGAIPKVPVYLDGMIFEATAIHTAYPEYLNSQLRTQIFQQGDNPFLSDIFHRVDSAQMRYSVLDSKEPCIILATSGMMSGGPVMEYFKAWAPEEKNGILFVGYQAEGTFGRRLQRGLSEATFLDNGRNGAFPVRLEVATIEGFSGHSDRAQLMNYIATLDPRPQRVVLNHGEESKALDLATGLHKRFNLESRVPYNLEAIRLV
ncbi:MAG: beta-CASP ribonuclease aCPSF1 [Thermoplasmata archaeon]|nr:beta-CASP ribonuclease aCPSF1 [Thermoplasmata archaeon]MCI4359882.1 beta-CASP ribonuclease aCPSF1 [Thermoplasmata archaeon]